MDVAFIISIMESEVFNTVIVTKSAPSGGDPSHDKFIFWGHINKTSGVTAPEVLALNKEERVDRFKTFVDFDSGGEHMIVVHPVEYGGEGKFLDENTGFTYPFDLSGTISITDVNGNTYDVNIYIWQRTSHGSIASLKTL
jgi:hypothetical protein